MKNARRLVAAVLVLFCATVGVIACSSGSSNAQDGGDARATDGGSDAGPVLVQLSVSLAGGATLELTPAFSSSILDYYVVCPADTGNALTVAMAANPGAESQLVQPTKSPRTAKQNVRQLSVDANDAIVAVASRESSSVSYWVRCLPPDFPKLKWQPHPAAGTPAPGYYLLGNDSSQPGYAFVLDGHGVPVWYHRDARAAFNVDSLVKGEVSYVPESIASDAPATLFELETSGATAVRVGPTGVPVDVRELRRFSNGDYVVISPETQTGVNLTGLSIEHPDGGLTALGEDSNIVGCKIVRFDPKDGTIKWQWNALDHFDPAKATQKVEVGAVTGDAGVPDGAPVYGVFHCNSLDVDPANDNLLVSARQMNSVFYIDTSTDAGKVVWKMGGSDASLDDAVYIPVDQPFYGQHDARMQPGWSTCEGGQISIFDDHAFSATPGNARANLYTVRLGSAGACGAKGAPGASLSWQFVGNELIVASGSFRVARDGSRVVGWGTSDTLLMTELDEKKNDLLDLSAVGWSMTSYRAIKVPLEQLDLDAMHATAGQ